MRILLLHFVFSALLPIAAVAQAPVFESDARDSGCAWRDAAAHDLGQLSKQLARAEADARRHPLLGPAVGLGVSGAGLVGGVMLASMYRDDEWEHVPALWSIPGVAAAGVIASGIALHFRLQRRRPFTRERALLRARMADRSAQLALYAENGCLDLDVLRTNALARLSAIDAELAAIDARARARSTTGPLVLIITGGAASAALLVSGILLAVGVINDEDANEPTNRTPMRATFAGMGGGLGILTGGVIWLALRKRQQSAIRSGGSALKKEKRQLDAVVQPAIGPSSLGLSLSGRF